MNVEHNVCMLKNFHITQVRTFEVMFSETVL